MVDEIIIVVNSETANLVSAAISRNRISVVVNPRPSDGMASSMKLGLEACHEESDAILIVHADMPLISTQIIDALVTRWTEVPDHIVAPCYKGQQGNPVILPRPYWDEIPELKGDIGCKAILKRHPSRVEWVEFDDESILLDVDTEVDLEEVRARWPRSRKSVISPSMDKNSADDRVKQERESVTVPAGFLTHRHSEGSGPLILIRGAGEMATAVAHRLWLCGFRTILTEIEAPMAVRRGVAFAEAVFSGSHSVEGVVARRISTLGEALNQIKRDHVPVIVDPQLELTAPALHQPATLVVDARMLKVPVPRVYPEGVSVIGLGPGFTAPENADFVIETSRGHHLGRVIEWGVAERNTGVPAEIQGASTERVAYAPQCGVFSGRKKIGESVKAGDIIGYVDNVPIVARLTGVLRGMLHDGTPTQDHSKVADIDPRNDPTFCFLISDKARAIAGGVLEAVLRILNGWSARKEY